GTTPPGTPRWPVRLPRLRRAGYGRAGPGGRPPREPPDGRSASRDFVAQATAVLARGDDPPGTPRWPVRLPRLRRAGSGRAGAGGGSVEPRPRPWAGRARGAAGAPAAAAAGGAGAGCPTRRPGAGPGSAPSRTLRPRS